ncbi:MAG: hypothetical protein ABI885_28430 [Gammaproteobacteria bacterium]
MSTPAASIAPPSKAHPDLSGFWSLTSKVPRDKALIDHLPPDTVVLDDTGAAEFPAGVFGGLKVKPKALEAAAKWNPRDDMSVRNACRPPSIVYAMQGPFPMEIFQGTEFIILKLEYFDLIRIVFMDGREHPPADAPHTKLGFSTGKWEGGTLVVDTTHLEPSTITNNGLNHSGKVHVIERFRLSEDGTTLLSTQEFEDPEVLDNRGARFIAWKRKPGEHVYPYDCDPTFALEYQK